jgi:oxygen-independent coproporphyrinogen-3 oxidase
VKPVGVRVVPHPGDGAPQQAATAPAARQGGARFSALPPLSLYVHVPWCVRKCPYCDFNSHVVDDNGAFPEDRYLAALRSDLEASLPQVWGRRVHTIFFGGGTPSLLSAPGFAQLMSDIRARLPLAADAEITLEANPGTVEAARFAAYRDAGVNRLSLGIQSFDDRHLQALGRVHDADEARAAVRIARDTFDNFNLDLMYALPDQTPEELDADLDQALAFEAPHLSVYHLTLEPNTVFAKYPPALPDEDAAADMQARIESRLEKAGYGHYETSAYARSGRRAAHNLNYWRFGDYLGIGAGAHGKITLPDRVLRTGKPRNPESYMAACESGGPIGSTREVSDVELPFEFMLNALRLTDGFESALFRERTGLDIGVIAARLERAVARGLVERDARMIRPSFKGRLFLNDLLEGFLD